MTDTALAGAPAKRAKRVMPQELNALLGLIAIALIFEALAWIIRDRTFLGNTQILRIMILQVAVVGIIAVGVTQVIRSESVV